MSDSICKFMPAKNYTGDIKICNFVYETELKTLSQPFFRPIYYIHLVTAGSGTLKMNGEEYPLTVGSLFFAFPAYPYELVADEHFRYIYISFMGSEIAGLFEQVGVSVNTPVYNGFDNLLEFWLSSIMRVGSHNANILAESVLLYTLSFFGEEASKTTVKPSAETVFDMMVDYVDTHYRDADLSLKKLAEVFSYTEKYISHLFKKRMGVGFNYYVNQLRLRYAHELLDESPFNMSEIATRCGYSDAFYFSKVFKKATGISPKDYRKK